jgi:Ran GTPase-activating protein (RanGAP) involved in mRNA processing and transport
MDQGGQDAVDTKIVIKDPVDQKSFYSANLVLESLGNLSCKNIGDLECVTLAEDLEKIPALQTLDLSHNNIGDEGCRALARGLAQVQAIDLSYNSIGYHGFKALQDVLVESDMIISLNLSRTGMEINGCRIISELMRRTKSITLLNVSKNQLGDEGCAVLTDSLRGNTSLENLDLSDNHIHAEGCLTLADVLSEQTTLKVLNISGNYIRDEGCQLFSHAIMKNKSVHDLRLAWNEIGDEGLKNLANSLKSNTCIRSLDLSGNWFGNGACKELADLLIENKALQELDLAANSIGDDGFILIQEVFGRGISLRALGLGHNSIGGRGVLFLLTKVGNIGVQVDLKGNPIPILYDDNGSIVNLSEKSSDLKLEIDFESGDEENGNLTSSQSNDSISRGKASGKVFGLRVDSLSSDLAHARYALQLSQDIYNLEDFEIFNPLVSVGIKDSQHGFVVIQDTLYIVHKGSSNEQDWGKDLREFKTVSNPFPGKIHSGFYQQALTKTWSHINNFLSSGEESTRQNRRVVFCGHSNGGAVAAIQCLLFLLDADVLPKFKEQVICVSFGTPLFCDGIVSKEIRTRKLNSKFHFFAIRGDPVPLVGVLFLNRQDNQKTSDSTKDLIARAHPLAREILELFTSEVSPNFAPIGTWYFSGEKRSHRISIDSEPSSIMKFLEGSIFSEMSSSGDALKFHSPQTYMDHFGVGEIFDHQKLRTSVNLFGVTTQLRTVAPYYEDLEVLVIALTGTNLEFISEMSCVLKDDEKSPRSQKQSLEVDFIESTGRAATKIMCRVKKLHWTHSRKQLMLTASIPYKFRGQSLACVINVVPRPEAPHSPENMTLLDLLCSLLFQVLNYPKDDPNRFTAAELLSGIEACVDDLGRKLPKECIEEINVVARCLALKMDNQRASQLIYLDSHQKIYAEQMQNPDVKFCVENKSYESLYVDPFRQKLLEQEPVFWAKIAPMYIPPLFLLKDYALNPIYFESFEKKTVSVTSWFHAMFPALIRIVLIFGSSHLNVTVAVLESMNFRDIRQIADASKWAYSLFFGNWGRGSLDKCYFGRVIYFHHILKERKIPTAEQIKDKTMEESVRLFDLEAEIAQIDEATVRTAVNGLKGFLSWHDSWKSFWENTIQTLLLLQKTIILCHKSRQHLKKVRQILIYGPEKNGKSTLMKLLWNCGEGGNPAKNTLDPQVFNLTNSGVYVIDLPGATSKEYQHRMMQQRLFAACSFVIGICSFQGATSGIGLDILRDVCVLPLPSIVFLTKTDDFIDDLCQSLKEQKDDAEGLQIPSDDDDDDAIPNSRILEKFESKRSSRGAMEFTPNMWSIVLSELNRRRDLIPHFESLVFAVTLLDFERIDAVYLSATLKWSKADRKAYPVFCKYERADKCKEILQTFNSLSKLDGTELEAQAGVISKQVLGTISNSMMCKNSIKVAIRLALVKDPQFGEILIPN